MSLGDIFYNKSILFLCVQTFNYEIEIKKRLEFHGAIVNYFDERPDNSHFTRGLLRIKRSLYKTRIDNYYKTILNFKNWESLDFCFVLRGEIVPRFFLIELKIRAPKCKFIFYTWDSFSNHPHPIKIIDLFNVKFTFDKNDAIANQMSHKGLFYLPDYAELRSEMSKQDLQYDVLFIGTAHSDRYFLVENIKNQIKSNGKVCFAYYFMHSKFVYFYNRIFVQDYLKVKLGDLKFKSLNKKGVVELFKKSKAILDIQHPKQNGLTMRTFEALGAGKKLITTNTSVKEYQFYNPRNILVIDRENPHIPLSFLESSFANYDDITNFEMSIDGWLTEIFSEIKNENNRIEQT